MSCARSLHNWIWTFAQGCFLTHTQHRGGGSLLRWAHNSNVFSSGFRWRLVQQVEAGQNVFILLWRSCVGSWRLPRRLLHVWHCFFILRYFFSFCLFFSFLSLLIVQCTPPLAESLQALTPAFTFTHTPPPEKQRRSSGVQCMSESRDRQTDNVDKELSVLLFDFKLTTNSHVTFIFLINACELELKCVRLDFNSH